MPIFYEDAEARIPEGWKCRPFTLDENDALDKEIPFKEADVALAQLLVGHTAKLHPVSTYPNRNPAYVAVFQIRRV